MLSALFDYFYALFDTSNNLRLQSFYNDFQAYTGYDFDLSTYFAYICSIISLIFIVVICCLFIYRLIRLVGRLFSGGNL